jgi:hypothetical protein
MEARGVSCFTSLCELLLKTNPSGAAASGSGSDGEVGGEKLPPAITRSTTAMNYCTCTVAYMILQHESSAQAIRTNSDMDKSHLNPTSTF